LGLKKYLIIVKQNLFCGSNPLPATVAAHAIFLNKFFIWNYKYLCVSSLQVLIKKGRGLWPAEALATHTMYSVV
jgi:hypothetical protein